MIECQNLEDAIEVAKEISAKRLECISIVKRCCSNDNFIICDNGSQDRDSNDTYIKLIKNFDTPYYMVYQSPKSGEHTDFFPTKELRDAIYSEKCATNYYYNFVLGKL